MKAELFEALEQIATEKGIAKEVLLETIEAALITAYKKNFGSSQNVRVIIDPDSGEFKVYGRREVVEESMDDFLEISIDEAREINPEYEIGDWVEDEVTPRNFGRIAAQTAKQVVVQRLREAERGIIYNEFSSRESELINGQIQRISKGTMYINLGRTEAVLLPSEQIPGEILEQAQRVKTYIVEVKKTSKGPQVLVSRTHPGLVKRLFELEVPEVYNGEVEIRAISREAGSRTKIAVFAPNEDIDPVGSCVGQRGARVQAVVTELNGEKIDIIKWSENPAEFISNALSPSKVEKVLINETEKSAMVVVPDYQLSLAIGKEGQNARLAAKLTGWKIDIKSETQYDEFIDQLEEGAEIAPGFVEVSPYETYAPTSDEDAYEPYDAEGYDEEYSEEYAEDYDNDGQYDDDYSDEYDDDYQEENYDDEYADDEYADDYSDEYDDTYEEEANGEDVVDPEEDDRA